ncbi:MAG: tetratricopeptide repeat protein [Candidatus Xenobiia bacterium LiM19]
MRKTFLTGVVVFLVLVGTVISLIVWRKVDTFTAAERSLRKGRLNRALASYEEALKKDPDNPTIYTNMGKTAERMGMFPESVEYYESAYKREPGSLASLENLYWPYYLTGRLDDALRVCETHLERAPHDTRFYSYIADIYLMKSLKDAAALDKAEEYIQKGDQSAESFYIRGKIDFAKGDNGSALVNMQKGQSLKLSPDDEVDSWFIIHKAALRAGEAETARKALHRVIDLSSDEGEKGQRSLLPYPEFAMLILYVYFNEKVDRAKFNRLNNRFRELERRGVQDNWNGREIHRFIARAIDAREKGEAVRDIPQAVEFWEKAHRVLEKYFGKDSKEVVYPDCFVGRAVIASSFFSAYKVYIGDLYREKGDNGKALHYYAEALKNDGDDCVIKDRLKIQR